MGQLENMSLFIRIVEAGGIGKAAGQLNLAKSAVSRRLNELEQQLGTQLLMRTTRKSNLTPAGELYYKKALVIIDDVADINAQTSGVEAIVEGSLKLTAPLSFGIQHLSPVLDEFSKRYPKLRVQIDFSDRYIDLIEEGYELAIRIGELKDSSLKAKQLSPIKHTLVASPTYLEQHGIPKTHAELNQHRFLIYGHHSTQKFQLLDAQGKAHSLQLNPTMQTNNGDFLKEMAIRGQGITYLPQFITYQALKSGELVPILEQYTLPISHLYAVYPNTRFLSQRCRLLIDFLATQFDKSPYWDN